MGNSNQSKSSFQEHNWRKIEEKKSRVILYNDITMKSVERHEAVLDCDQGEAISLCKWRASLPQDCGVVDLYEYGIKTAGMCNSQADLYVVTQRIHLLQEIGAVSKPQAFIILRDVANGLHILYKKFGHFNPRPNLIGINSTGRARVWTNENFAKLEPQPDIIPIEGSQLAIVNNLIRILESKTYIDHSLPIDYPRNLNLVSVVNYINKVFMQLKGFEVDRVYIDRSQFNKKYNELRVRQEKQELSRMMESEADRRYKQIQMLHQNLRRQQMDLARKEEQIHRNSLQQQARLRQQQMQKQFEIKRHQQLLAAQQIQLAHQTKIINNQRDNIDLSQRKLLNGATNIHPSQYSSPPRNQPQSFQQNLPYNVAIPQSNFISPQNFRQNSVPIFQANQTFQQSYQNIPSIPSSIPKNPQSNGKPPLNPKQRPLDQEKMKKQIQMVDSMILMQEDSFSQQNKRFIQSRIVTYRG